MNDLPERKLSGDCRGPIGDASLPQVVVVGGPTAVGKTALSIHLARTFNGEVINADSRYLYRGFSIGVAKPTIAERQGVLHHLIDVLDPGEEMSLALYQQRALAAIRSVHERGKLPFLTGGTPLYINAVVEGWRIPAVPPNAEFRARTEGELASHGLALLVDRLRSVDPVAADRSGQNPRRVIRALEIYEATGRPMSELEGKEPPPFRTLQIGLTMPREQLFRAIDARVDDQIAAGLLDEARSLLAAGVDPASPAFSSIGYRQLIPFFEGSISLEEAIERIKFDTHRYVRHQETWMRRNREMQQIDVTDPRWRIAVEELVRQFLADARSETEIEDRKAPLA